MRFRGLLSGMVMSLAALPAFAQSDAPVSADERAKIERVIVDLLEREPELVIGAIQEFQRRQRAAQIVPKLAQYRDYLENDDNYPVLGNPDGDVTVVEFFDYRCGFCKRHFPAVMTLLEEDKNIRFVPRQFPVLDRPGEPQISMLAARAAMAAHAQGKFEDFHIATLTHQGSLSEDDVYGIAERVGLDMEQLRRDMNSALNDKIITNSLSIGRDLGFSGTPSYIIGNDVILGAEGLDALRARVDAARKDQAAAGR